MIWANRIIGHDNVDPSELKANASNWRLHPTNQRKALKGVIDEVGWVDDIMVNKRTSDQWGDKRYVETLIDGHLRLELALSQKAKTVPVKYVDLNPDEEKLVLATLDPIGAMATTDSGKLDSILGEIKEDHEKLIELVGHSMPALDGSADPDEIPDTPKDPIAKSGDLWALGPHRLLCGDSTNKSDVNRLMDGHMADMVFTDPPYGINLDTDYSKIKSKKFSNIKGKKFKRVQGDGADFKPDLIKSIFENYGYVDEIFLFGADNYSELLKDRRLGTWLVWDKCLEERYDKMFGSCFELCWSKQKHKRLVARFLWSGMFSDASERSTRREHPTQKPVGLVKWFLKNWGKKAGLICDPFLGSGTTMIACEQFDRSCYGMEIDPVYCDVIVKRWENFTGEKAKLVR